MENKKIFNLVDNFDTPLYIYDIEKIYSKIGLLKEFLPYEMNTYYSLKANPSIGLLSSIKKNISGVEVSSEGELYISRYVGIPVEKIIFVGPGKTADELEYAVNSNILSIVVESFEELEKVNQISIQKGIRTKIAVRINPESEVAGARIKMGGAAKQFGIDEEYLEEFVAQSKKHKNIILEGLHVYMGTQVLDSGMLVNNFNSIFAIAKKMKYEYKVDLKLIDFGGGFGIPYFPGEKELDVSILKEGFAKVFDENRGIFDFDNINLIAESGRFLVAESGVFLTKVLYKKSSRGKIFIIVDGGFNNHASAAGMGRFIRHNFPIEVIGKVNSNEKEVVDVVGPLCTPTDILAQNVELPVINEGDIIAIRTSGAYGLTASMKDFLSHPAPAEVIINGDKHWLIRKRGKKEDFLIGQIF